jgi:hypothetical protein
VSETNQVQRLVSFDPDDVIKVAKALLEDHWYWDSGDYSKDQCCCNYCSGRTPYWSKWGDYEKIPHDNDCPVLIARDLLKGS